MACVVCLITWLMSNFGEKVNWWVISIRLTSTKLGADQADKLIFYQNWTWAITLRCSIWPFLVQTPDEKSENTIVFWHNSFRLRLSIEELNTFLLKLSFGKQWRKKSWTDRSHVACRAIVFTRMSPSFRHDDCPHTSTLIWRSVRRIW